MTGISSTWVRCRFSGAALVILEQTAVEPAGRISHGCLGLYSDANEAALARVVGFCRRPDRRA